MSKIKAFMSKFWLMRAHTQFTFDLSIIIATKAYILSSKPKQKETVLILWLSLLALKSNGRIICDDITAFGLICPLTNHFR